MVKKFLIGLGLMLFFVTSVNAEPLNIGEVASGLPFKQGIAYSIKDSAVNYLSTVEVASFKGVTFEIGTAGDSEESGWKAVGVVSYPVLKLSQWVDLPILKYLELNLGVYCGVGNITFSELRLDDQDNRLDYGISASLLTLKF